MSNSTTESFINQNLKVLSQLFDHFTDLVFVMSVEKGNRFRYQAVNEAAKRHEGLERDVTGLLIEEVVDEELAALLNEKYREAAETKRTVTFECRHSGDADSSTETVLNPFFDATGQCTHIVAVTRDVTERIRHEQQLREMAFTDSLTNLLNCRGFQEAVERLIRKADQNAESFAVIFLDCDLFKQINDEFGHSIGDEFLNTFAKRMKHSVREGDLVARMGGDEFIILLPFIRNKQEVELIVQRLLGMIRQPWKIGDLTLGITGSIGVAVYPQDGQTTDELLKNADLAMYQVKACGRDGYRFFS